MKGGLYNLIAEFFYTLNPILWVAFFVLFSLYLNNVIIKFRINEFDRSLSFISSKDNSNHALNIFSKFEQLRDQYEGEIADLDQVINEAKFQAISSQVLIDNTAVQYNISEKILLNFLSGLRFLLGKEANITDLDPQIRFKMEQAYYLERLRKYQDALNVYGTVLIESELPADVRATVLIHYAFCESILGGNERYVDAQEKLNEIIQGENYKGTDNQKVAQKLKNEIENLTKRKKSAAKLSLNPFSKGKEMYLAADYKMAEYVLEKFVEKKGKTVEQNVESAFYLGRIKEETGDHDKAIERYHQVIKTMPNSKWGKQATRRLLLMGKFYLKDDKLSKVALANTKYYEDTAFVKEMKVFEKIEKQVREEAKKALDTTSAEDKVNKANRGVIGKKAQTDSIINKDQLDTSTSVDKIAHPDSFSADTLAKSLNATGSLDSLLISKKAPNFTPVDNKIDKFDSLLNDLQIPVSKTSYKATIPQEDFEVIGPKTNEKTGLKEGKTKAANILSDPVRKEEILTILNVRKNELIHIFKKWRRRGVDLEGKLVINIVISAQGYVKSTKISTESSNLKNDEFTNEVLKKVRAWRFRPVNDLEPDVSIKLPIMFVSSEVTKK